MTHAIHKHIFLYVALNGINKIYVVQNWTCRHYAQRESGVNV